MFPIDGNVRYTFTGLEFFILGSWKFLFQISNYRRSDCIFQKSEMIGYLQIFFSDRVMEIASNAWQVRAVRMATSVTSSDTFKLKFCFKTVHRSPQWLLTVTHCPCPCGIVELCAFRLCHGCRTIGINGKPVYIGKPLCFAYFDSVTIDIGDHALWEAGVWQ